MRILFLCSSLEPGRDGVGDYTRLLAAECARRGAECSIIALHDRHMSADAAALRDGEDAGIPILRLGSQADWRDRVQSAAEFLAAFRPDWVSVQFVPYGFHDKGIVAALPARLRDIVKGTRRLHFMAHELWIGAAQSASLKERIIGTMQKHYIRQLIRVLRPRLVTTTNAVYVSMLARLGVRAIILPLFGNIPIDAAASESEQKLNAVLGANGIERANSWLGVFFGTIHPQWTAEPIFPVLLKVAKANGKRLCLVAAGRLGATGESMWNDLSTNYGSEISFVKLGELPPSGISSILVRADFGVATSPWELIGKSGSAAAMIDHGLPVLAGRDDWHLRGSPRPASPTHALLYRLDDKSDDKLASGLPKRTPESQLTQVAASFLADLNAS
jgi:hypothetical protein